MDGDLEHQPVRQHMRPDLFLTKDMSALEMNGLGRIWAGVHFRNSLQVSDQMGRKITAFLVELCGPPHNSIHVVHSVMWRKAQCPGAARLFVGAALEHLDLVVEPLD